MVMPNVLVGITIVILQVTNIYTAFVKCQMNISGHACTQYNTSGYSNSLCEALDRTPTTMGELER